MADQLHIHVVETARDRAAFLDLPWRIYAGSPCWVPPLRRIIRHQLDFRAHPFWQHAEGCLFIACRGAAVLGRICAQIDHAYIAQWHEPVGSFGFFECVDEVAVARALVQAAAAWLQQRGMRVLRGPMSPSCHGEWGLLIEGFARPPTLLMPYNPPYYRALLEACGLRPVKTVLAYEKTQDSQSPAVLARIAARLLRNSHVRIECLRKAELKHRAETVRLLYNATWSAQWGFTPLSAGEMNEFLDAVRFFGREELAWLAFYDDQPAGLCITLPDINEILRDANGRLGLRTLWRLLFQQRRITGCRTMLVGFLPQFRRTGLPALLYHISEPYIRAHFQRAEFSWILEDNLPMQMLIGAIGATVSKRYQLFELQLPVSPPIPLFDEHR